MTVAAKDTLSALGKMVATRGGNPWRRLWQIPLLIAGIAGFSFGLRAFINTIHPVPFEKQAAAIESLIEGGQFATAISEINRLDPYYQKELEQARLDQLAGDALFLSQKDQPVPVRENYERALNHYKQAVAGGLTPSVEMNERWGETAMFLGDGKTAIDRLELAIQGSENNPELIQRHARDLVTAYLEAGKMSVARQIVDKVLEALKKSPPKSEMAAMEEETWYLCKRIEIALSEGNAAALKSAVQGARTAIPGLAEHDPQGRVLVWIGRSELEQGDTPAAERDLTEARKNFAVHHLDDGRAAVLLGRIHTSKGELDKAAALFAEVVLSHSGTPVWAAARLGRADVASRKGVLSGTQLLEDYRYAIATLKEMDAAPVGKKPEMLNADVMRDSLLESYQRARDAKKHSEALTFLALDMQIEERPTADTAIRLATTRELRGRELLEGAAGKEEPARSAQIAEGRALLVQSALDYLQHASLTTLEDEISGQSLWKAAGLLDSSGETAKAITVYERLTIQRPRDPRVPEGLLALGQLYESAGMLDKAIARYQRNIRENPTTAAAYASQVNEARCDVALAKRAATMGEKKALLDKAERLLLGLVQDNTNLLPTAREFHDSLFALADLYFQSPEILADEPVAKAPATKPAASAPAASTAPASAPATTPAPVIVRTRWSDAILRLDEILGRFPRDPATPRTVFMLAESYRRSADEISEAIRRDPGIARRAELERARAERLLIASDHFSRVVALLDSEMALTAPAARRISPLEEQYLRSSYMNRAACLFARGDYEQAIRRYTEAAARFSEETLAVEAYVQIVNAYLAMQQTAQAAAAADRGRWLLKRVPESAFATIPPGGASRGYYEKLLAMDKN